MSKSQNKGPRIAGPVFLSLLVILPFVYLSTSQAPDQASNGIRTYLQNLLHPIDRGVWYTLKTLSEVWGTYVSGVATNQQLRHLEAENLSLKTQLQLSHDLSLEVARLRELLTLPQKKTIPMIGAEVLSVASGRASAFYTLRLSKGSYHGVDVGMPVIGPKGVIGRILRVGFLHSDVHLLTDSSFDIDVIVERTRTRAIVHGQGSSTLALSSRRRSDVKIGDLLITSGLVGGFPKGLPVGEVTQISFSEDRVYQEVTVEPHITPESLETVFILMLPNSDVEKVRNELGNQWIEETLDSYGNRKL